MYLLETTEEWTSGSKAYCVFPGDPKFIFWYIQLKLLQVYRKSILKSRGKTKFPKKETDCVSKVFQRLCKGYRTCNNSERKRDERERKNGNEWKIWRWNPGDQYIMEEESGKKYKSIDFLCAES